MKKETSDKDKKKKTTRRVGVKCIFERIGTRDFVTPGNFEACNMLSNKLAKRGIKRQEGKLVFEFESVVKKKEGD